MTTRLRLRHINHKNFPVSGITCILEHGSPNVVSVYKPIASGGRRKSNHGLYLWDLSKVQRVVSSLLGLISYTRTRAKAPVKCKTTLCDVVSGCRQMTNAMCLLHIASRMSGAVVLPHPPKKSLGLYRNIVSGLASPFFRRRYKRYTSRTYQWRWRGRRRGLRAGRQTITARADNTDVCKHTPIPSSRDATI